VDAFKPRSDGSIVRPNGITRRKKMLAKQRPERDPTGAADPI
jgi:hypothetical protein